MNLIFDKLITDIEDQLHSNSRIRKTTKHFSYGKGSKLYVVTPWWQATVAQMPMRILKKRIKKAGHSSLIYQFPIKILSENPFLTEEYFKDIQKEVIKDIYELTKKYDYQEIIMIGISLGCVNALMAANHNKKVHKIILVVPGDSLSESLWRGLGTLKLKRAMKKKGIRLNELEKDWASLDPKNNIDGLTGKDIAIFLSRADKIIPYTNGNRLVKDMRELGLSPAVIRNKSLGHYLTPLKFILFYKF